MTTDTTSKTHTASRGFDLTTLDDAPDASKPYLEAAQSKFGFVPNLYRVLANNPAALAAYAGIAEALAENGTLSPVEQQIVMLTSSRENECSYCVAAHSTVGQQVGLSAASIDAIREDRSLDDPKLESLRRLTKALIAERGGVSDEALAEFRDAGYGAPQVLELITILSLKTLSNYTNHIAETPLDEAFEANRWAKTG